MEEFYVLAAPHFLDFYGNSWLYLVFTVKTVFIK